MIDQNKKRLLIEHIDRLAAATAQEIMLDVDLYFDGYDEPQCTICANNRVQISTSDFCQRLKHIQARNDVDGVFVRFYEYQDALEFEQCWIGSDSVYVITSANIDLVKEWFADFEVSDVWEETKLKKFMNLPEIPCGHSIYAIWWD
jgi:hypothetical protein